MSQPSSDPHPAPVSSTTPPDVIHHPPPPTPTRPQNLTFFSICTNLGAIPHLTPPGRPHQPHPSHPSHYLAPKMTVRPMIAGSTHTTQKLTRRRRAAPAPRRSERALGERRARFSSSSVCRRGGRGAPRGSSCRAPRSTAERKRVLFIHKETCSRCIAFPCRRSFPFSNEHPQ